MTVNPSDHPLLGALFGDVDIVPLFSSATEIRVMIDVEIALARVQAQLGIIPAPAAEAICVGLADYTPPDSILAEGTRTSGVIVPPLVKALRAAVGPPHGDYVHWGATTQDIADTAFVLRLRAALDLLEARLDAVIAALADAAERYGEMPMAARTRSQVATPTTFGLRIAGWLSPLLRCKGRLAELRPRLLVVQLGGAAGTLGVFGARGVDVMAALAAELTLAVPLKPWHAERDSLIELANWLALVTGALGKMAGDLILMGRSESREARAGEGGGSSTMPQKANPVAAETMIALARHNAGQIGIAHQAMIHAEERDGSAWALEWMVLPQMVVSTGAALSHAEALACSLAPDADRMQAMLGDEVMAEAIAFALAEQGSLGEAQALVKRAFREGGSLLDALGRLTQKPLDRDALGDPMTTLGAAQELIMRVVEHSRQGSATRR